MAMTREQMEKLLEVIDAKIATHGARNDWDGGLHESICESELVKELEELCPSEED